MKKLLAALLVALLVAGCGSSDFPQDSFEDKSFNSLLMVRCEACGLGISKKAKTCLDCGHPNPIDIALQKRKEEEAKRLVDVEQKRLMDEKAKTLAEMELKTIEGMKANGLAEEERRQRGKATNEAQKRQLGVTILNLEVRGGEKPTQVVIGNHPRPRFNGTYQAQAKHVNERTCYKNENDMYLYFYDQAEGGEKGWSLDHREPDGKKDHYSGGWYYLKSFSHLNSKCKKWLDVH